jgi:hypothetical protein
VPDTTVAPSLDSSFWSMLMDVCISILWGKKIERNIKEGRRTEYQKSENKKWTKTGQKIIATQSNIVHENYFF